MSHEQDIDKHVRTYIKVFGALLVLTVVTVAVSYLHLSTGAAIALALVVATVKGSLVACYFMHLLDERKLILSVLLLTVLFFFFVLIGPWATELNPIVL
ncbi:MAG: cytochrome C oxidase subunit IV family protein [Deltaproteobacteria bacterium]|nr:cytochrome C oxidase subunit IV family protein [Deltaproteobacteria bacterium]